MPYTDISGCMLGKKTFQAEGICLRFVDLPPIPPTKEANNMRSASIPLIGALFCVAGLCLAVSLLSYSSADPPEFRFYYAAGFHAETFHNWLGMPGAFIAAALLIPFGYAAYLMIIPLTLYGVRFICRLDRPAQTFEHPVMQCSGFLLAGIGFAGLLSFLPDWLFASPLFFMGYSPLIGPGGYSGTILTTLLSANIATAGIVIFLISMILAGFVLVGDRTAIRLIDMVFESKTNTTATGADASFAAPAYAAQPYTTTLRREPASLPLHSAGDRHDATTDWGPKINLDSARSRPQAFKIHMDELEGEYGDEECGYEEYDDEEYDNEENSEAAPVESAPYELPSSELLELSEKIDDEMYDDSVHERAVLLEKVLLDFKIKAKVVDVQKGPVITQYELRLEKGTRIKKIQQLQDDLGVELRTGSVRIVAPIPGKNTVGVELPNEIRQMVRLRDVIDESAQSGEEFALPLYLGKGITGNPIVMDLAKMPHLLIAGQTGTGKSVCLNSIIVSILMTRTPEQVRMLMIDPKQVEFGPYQRIPHLNYPVVDDMQKAAGVLSWSVDQMEERYELLKKAGVRNITEYNKLSEDDLRRRMNMIDADPSEWDGIPKTLSYLVIIADEVGDLIKSAKEVEGHIVRLAQKSRAAGIHLILATQKPTADAFSSLIKTNLPARIAFRVSNKTDSMVILDRVGAEQLLGKGDMLILQDNEIIRGQGALVTDDEIEAINEKIGTDRPNFDEDLLDMDAPPDESDDFEETNYDGKGKIGRDELYYQAVDLVINKERGSVSMLQSCLGIGYPRASRMMDFMEEDGIVSKANASKPRTVLISTSEWQRKRNDTPGRRPSVHVVYEEEYESEEAEFIAD